MDAWHATGNSAPTLTALWHQEPAPPGADRFLPSALPPQTLSWAGVTETGVVWRNPNNVRPCQRSLAKDLGASTFW